MALFSPLAGQLLADGALAESDGFRDLVQRLSSLLQMGGNLWLSMHRKWLWLFTASFW